MKKGQLNQPDQLLRKALLLGLDHKGQSPAFDLAHTFPFLLMIIRIGGVLTFLLLDR